MSAAATRALAFFAIACLVLLGVGCATREGATRIDIEPARLETLCRPEILQRVVSALSVRVTVQQITNGPGFVGGTRFVGATESLPAYCQVTGSFVTNPGTGKTANFLATLPANWNGRYLQTGCSGHCGAIAANGPPSPPQHRHPIARGYASFTTDEGHGPSSTPWAINASGEVNRDAVDDFLYRATMVLAHMGKEFTRAFYAEATGAPREIVHAYFSGCSGGGRDALVAASYFPEEFDGIIAGSPYAQMAGVAFQRTGTFVAALQTPDASVWPALMARIDPIVKAQCDRIDGVEDGLIQNPAACEFRPERDLPHCAPGTTGDACFTDAQIAALSIVLTAMTDEHGAVLQPGYSVSELQTSVRAPANATLESVDQRRPYEVLKYFASDNDPNYVPGENVALRGGGPGGITDNRIIVASAEFARVTQAVRMGVGVIPENSDRLLHGDTRLLIWSNLSDQLLTPYMALNYYNQLAARHGGFATLQRQVRLFGLPGTSHCGMDGVGPTSFDALSAMEAWVERGDAPNALLASLYASRPDPASPWRIIDYDRPPVRTMPLCMYPQMAHYNGLGDVNDGANWSCPEGDNSMLRLGDSGRRAGVYTFEGPNLADRTLPFRRTD